MILLLLSAPSVLAEEPVRLGTMPFNTMVYPSTITSDLVTAIRGVSNSIPDVRNLATTNDVLDTKQWVSTNYLSVAFWNSSLAPTLQGMIDRKASTNSLSYVSNRVEATWAELVNEELARARLSNSFSVVSNAVEAIAAEYRPLDDNAFPTVVVTNEQPSVSLLCTTNNFQLSILPDQILVKTNALDPDSRYSVLLPSGPGRLANESVTNGFVTMVEFTNALIRLATDGIEVDGHTYRLVEVVR